MEYMFSCLGCVLIGIILSAPMGPVGMLCVQQTLNRGRATGLLTGLGAALSDWFYCWVAALSMKLIIGFIERHTAAFAIVGGLLLAVFSALMMRSRPSSSSAAGSASRGAGAVAAGFVLAFSNPLIIFLIMPLMVYFGVPQPDYEWWQYALCLVAVLAGAMLWWWLVTYGVERWRRSMTLATLHRVNVTMGIVMLALSAYSIWRGVRLLA